MEFGDIQMNINKLQEELNLVQNSNVIVDQHSRIVFLNKELEKWFNIQKELYNEKSRDKFVTDMDYNTRYFHSLVNRKKHRNNIDALCDNSDTWFNDRDGINQLPTTHFSSIACSANPVFDDTTFDYIPTLLTDVNNDCLISTPSKEEILYVVKSMSSWSSSGAGGFQAGFYQTQWKHVGNDVVEVVEKFFESGFMLRSLNITYISLIS
ncbi:uncharacterized protein LOC113350827 [Papaver somniferum]|uniref:uncharacterized protein LOC113350827 n=1 Tax=Papaver somniferum TaxID=3469 RepID=UPI000E6FA193|nr:uncharacterized protein LOC113350827 [Papaver somniferum]